MATKVLWRDAGLVPYSTMTSDTVPFGFTEPSTRTEVVESVVNDDLIVQHAELLKEEGPAPTGKWADLEALLPVRDFKARHASTLLTFDAVVDAMNQIEAKQREAAHG